MKKAGFWLMSFGIESGNQKILDNANKKTTLAQAKITTTLANKNDILTLGHFILGLPGETKETITQTINFSKELPLDFAMFYIATPFPGSRLYENLKKQGKIKDLAWKNFEYSKKTIKSPLDLEKIRKQAHKEFYFSNKLRRIRRIQKVLGLRSMIGILFSGISFIKIFNEK